MSIFDIIFGRPLRRRRQRLVFDNSGNIKLEDEEADFREDEYSEEYDERGFEEEGIEEGSDDEPTQEEVKEPEPETVPVPEKKEPVVVKEPPKPKIELPKFDPHTPIEVTGYDVTYVIPKDMKSVVVEIQNADGSYDNHYTLTRYLSIDPGQRLRITIK